MHPRQDIKIITTIINFAIYRNKNIKISANTIEINDKNPITSACLYISIVAS